MSKQNILKDAKNGTRIYNSDHDIFYIKTKKGWQRDDEFTSLYRRQDKQNTGKLNFGLTGEPGAPTIGSDGSYSISEMGFVITDKSNPEIADTLRKSEQARVNVRDELKVKKGKSYQLNQYNALLNNKKESIKFYQKQYPHLDIETIFNKAHASGNPKEYLLKNHNLQIGQSSKPGPSQFFSKGTPTGKISSFYFDSLDKIQKLEKTLNINQPKPIKYNKPELKPTYSQNERGGSNELTVNNNNNKSKVVSDTEEPSNKVSLEPGKKYAMADTSKVKKTVKKKQEPHRFSWEKDLDAKDAKKLQNIRNVFGDYRNELNANKKAKGSEANRKKLTGPMNQHTAEMLGLL